ncbi:MAG: ATP-binding cassette domain-containing protein [Eubacteriales bacterium]|nr:ATP-binding cassette domain-containing protein [Eubacteriales bacterium]
MENILILENVTKKYGSFEALKRTDIKLTNGIYAILGLNGAGKTTFINLLTDNIVRTSGSICYNGTEIKKLGSRYRNIIGYMPQEQGYYEEFSGREYLAYIAGLKGIKSKRKVVDAMLNQFNLSVKADIKIKNYSGGMKQRLMLAQALLNEPQILILDEPTTGLDPVERTRFKEYIRELSKEKIIMYCTHIISDITNLADKILIIKNGRIFEDTQVEMLRNNFDENDMMDFLS